MLAKEKLENRNGATFSLWRFLKVPQVAGAPRLIADPCVNANKGGRLPGRSGSGFGCRSFVVKKPLASAYQKLFGANEIVLCNFRFRCGAQYQLQQQK